MQLGEFLGDRNNPVVPLVCQECWETVFTKGTMTFDNVRRQAILEVEAPDHEHEIFFEKRIVSYF
jgi:hypothetical protein